MDKEAKIYIAGHKGMVGRATLFKCLGKFKSLIDIVTIKPCGESCNNSCKKI